MGVPPLGKEKNMTKTMVKTLVRMKSTEMGKDDDGWETLKYNEGCECRIGPDLLKAFKAKNAVEILKEKKDALAKKKNDSTETKDDSKSETSSTNPPSKDSEPAEVETPKKQKGHKKKSK